MIFISILPIFGLICQKDGDSRLAQVLSKTFYRYWIMAKNAPKPAKAQYLIKANAMLEIITLKLRLLLDLKLANETKIFQLQSETAEIGRMLGGWLKSMQNN